VKRLSGEKGAEQLEFSGGVERKVRKKGVKEEELITVNREKTDGEVSRAKYLLIECRMVRQITST